MADPGAAQEIEGRVGPRKAGRPEILAPAGSEEAFAAALASGADAVYLGLAEGFNARSRSTAFTVDRLPELVARAHAANTKLYLTLNTLVFERELELLERLLRHVLATHVDALIVQDPATALLARLLAPSIRLHASTQMTISSAEGALFASTLGVTRIVLPRELSTEEIARVARESSLEIEVFVHGALCMSWSGQCLTSEAFSDRSANRGQCSQACRMPYQAIVDGEKLDLGDQRYLLSPQDLAAHEALPELVQSGVQSLKIEGRYKGPAYVSAAVDSWRHHRDALLHGTTEQDRARLERDAKRAELTFSRGASLGFLRGENHQTLVVATTPKHRGLALGEVRDVRARSVTVKCGDSEALREFLRPGVGVKFELVGRSDAEHDPENAPGGPLFGVRFVREDIVELSFGQPGPELGRVRAGDAVRLTGDPEITREAERRIARPVHQRIPLELAVVGRAGEPLRVTARARQLGRVQVASAQSRSLLESSRAGELDRAILLEKLGALGGTPFRLDDLDRTGLAAGLHLPVSELKRVRRELVAELERKIAEGPSVALAPEPCLPALRRRLALPNADDLGPPAIVPLCRTEEQLDAILASDLPQGSEVELDWMEMVGLARAVERARAGGMRVTLATVRVQKPGEEAYDRRLAKLEPEGVLVRHWGALMHFARLQKERANERELALHGDFSLNVTNSVTAHHLLGLGLRSVTASHDLNREQLLDLLRSVPRGRVAVTLHHHIPTFHNSHCVYAHLLSSGRDYRTCGRPCEEHRVALRDYAGHEHPVVVDVSCRNTVFNALAQSAAPMVPSLLELGVRRFRVELVWERGDVVARTLDVYRKLLSNAISADAALQSLAVDERYGVTTPLRLRKR